MDGSGDCRQPGAEHRCGNGVEVVQNFCFSKKSLLVREILIDDTKRANNTATTVTNRVKILKEKFSQSLGLPFEELLPESAIRQVVNELKIKYRRRLFDPIVTLWAFLSQILDVDKSCHNATSRVISYLAGESVEIPSTDPSAYCQARSRLPEELLQKLFSKVAHNLEEKVTIEDVWCGRNVKVIDSSTVSMPDTVENQQAYPQPKSQKLGCGFPIAKIAVIFSLACGAAVALAIDTLNTHDLKLARKLYQFLNPSDVLLGLECGDKKINQPSLSYLSVYTSYSSGLRAGLFFQSQAP